jgi:hypothetical protein
MKTIFTFLLLISSIAHAQHTVKGIMSPKLEKSDWIILYKIEGTKQVFVNNTSTPPDYGTWKGTKTIPDNDYVFNEFVGTWHLLSESEDGADLFLTACQLKSTIVVSPTILLINDFSNSSYCGFDSCRIYS